jgi:molybdopterin/thiamine biosynthesis adenylyltransferase
LVFITFPAYDTYKNKLDNNQLQETINYMDLIEKRNDNVYYFNLLNENDFMQEDFFDADHLNKVEASKLTKKITSRA